MAKVEFGEYAAFNSRGGIRYMHQGKMISEKAIPPEIIPYLEEKLANKIVEELGDKEPATFPMPTAAERARLLEESLKVPDELKLTPEEEATRVVPDNEAPLVADDFDEPDIGEAQKVLGDYNAKQTDPLAIAMPTDTGSNLPPTVSEPVDPSFLESVSIHTAPVEALAQALYDRCGIYTVYLGVLPRSDEINPLTGDTFSKYHLGIAYQAAIQAQARGLKDPEGFRQSIEHDRLAGANFKETLEPIAHTLGEARQQDSFAFRTSVQSTRPQAATEIVHIQDENGQTIAVQREVQLSEHGGTARSRFDTTEDEQVLEPPIFGQKPIIKPNW